MMNCRIPFVFALMTTAVGPWTAFGGAVFVADKAELLSAVAASSDGNGRLVRDLDVVFDRDCKPMTVGARDLRNASAKCLLDCAGHRITLDASPCPIGTVTVGGADDGVAPNGRTDAVVGCGAGSAFRNLTFVNFGRISFASTRDTLVKGCDFIGCGSADGTLGEGGAIAGCGIVQDCGFERCGARFGGAVSRCGYVLDSLFIDCRASEAGGAVFGDTDVARCEFRACGSGAAGRSAGLGGAIYGGCDIVSSLFVDCSAGKGGAIMSDSNRDDLHVKVVHCTFIRCRGADGGEAVFENSGALPVWMMNCLGYGCDLWQDGADEEDKIECYRLEGTDFFWDFGRGDYHPNGALSEEWSDPGGLAFGTSGAGPAAFSCRDLDGFGYDLSSPWPFCPGCYRFRPRRAGPVEASSSGGRRIQDWRRQTDSARRARTSPRPRFASAESTTSVRNRPIKVVSRRIDGRLIDLSELPCEIRVNEIPHEGNDFMDFLAPWYENHPDLYRFFESCGPYKIPEIGVDPGYGCPGTISPYEEDEELKGLESR